MLEITLLLIFFTVSFASYTLIPAFYNRATIVGQKQQQKLSDNMEQLLTKQEAQRMSKMFLLAPVAFIAGFWILFPEEARAFGVVMGIICGIIFPGIYIKMLTAKTRAKFANQLIDALLIMSSSFRGGLSLVQALEAVVEEMPDPINREFGIVLGENKMGVSLEEALYHLYNRMPSNALQQMITAILLARETGGNLPIIFNRIVTNIRESNKIRQNLKTLTIQGKIQGIIMILLPVGFTMIVYQSNRRVFEHMLVSDMGRSMLIYAVISWAIGAILVWKISSFSDF